MPVRRFGLWSIGSTGTGRSALELAKAVLDGAEALDETTEGLPEIRAGPLSLRLSHSPDARLGAAGPEWSAEPRLRTPGAARSAESRLGTAGAARPSAGIGLRARFPALGFCGAPSFLDFGALFADLLLGVTPTFFGFGAALPGLRLVAPEVLLFLAHFRLATGFVPAAFGLFGVVAFLALGALFQFFVMAADLTPCGFDFVRELPASLFNLAAEMLRFFFKAGFLQVGNGLLDTMDPSLRMLHALLQLGSRPLQLTVTFVLVVLPLGVFATLAFLVFAPFSPFPFFRSFPFFGFGLFPSLRLFPFFGFGSFPSLRSFTLSCPATLPVFAALPVTFVAFATFATFPVTFATIFPFAALPVTFPAFFALAPLRVSLPVFPGFSTLAGFLSFAILRPSRQGKGRRDGKNDQVQFHGWRWAGVA